MVGTRAGTIDNAAEDAPARLSVRRARLSGLLSGLVVPILLVVPSSAAAQSTPSPCVVGPQLVGDELIGTVCNDVIIATSPTVRVIIGFDGDDVIHANPNVIRVVGGLGDDTLYGELPESSTSNRAPSTESAAKSSGATASGGCPAPGCYLGLGNAEFFGSPGDDVIFGQRGNDVIDGEGGVDWVYGGTGDDDVYGGTGDDLVSGGFGSDDVFGLEGNDLVRADAGNDGINANHKWGNGFQGNAGSDTLSFASAVTPGFLDPDGFNLPPDNGERGVYVNLGGTQPDNRDPRYGGGQDNIGANEFENVIGSPFSDYIVGSSSLNRIDGGGGGDVILGQGGGDVLYGGADGDHLDSGGGGSTNGNAGLDYCTGASFTSSCNELRPPPLPTTGVVPRQTNTMSVGFLATDALNQGWVHLYLTGSSLSDQVSVTYATPSSGAHNVTFTATSGIFDLSGDAQTIFCRPPELTRVICDLPKPLDVLVLAGMAGNDVLTTDGFPNTTSVVLLGGEGDDQLTGRGTEDVLADGPSFTAPGNDRLYAFGGDDALLNNGGADYLEGEDGNDVLVSASVCNSDTIRGGLGDDSASWAQLGGVGVFARLTEGNVGRTGGGDGVPVCGPGEAFDQLFGIDDLEGSNQGDALYGSEGPNYVLGRLGNDAFAGRDGTDLLQTNEGQIDSPIDCGGGSPDVAWFDNTVAESPSQDCEIPRGLLPGAEG